MFLKKRTISIYERYALGKEVCHSFWERSVCKLLHPSSFPRLLLLSNISRLVLTMNFSLDRFDLFL